MSTKAHRGRSRRRCGVEVLEARFLLATFTVNTRFDIVDASDSLTSLREAIEQANDETANPGHDTIDFDPALKFAMIHADYQGFDENGDPITGGAGGQFEITSDLTIDASSAGLVRLGHERGFAFRHRIFEISGASGPIVKMVNVVVQGGDAGADGEIQHGGGIWNAGELTLRNSVVGSNFAIGASGGGLKGGGIYNAANGTLTLENTHVGEVLLDSEFLAGIGVNEQFYAKEEQREREQLELFVVRIPAELVDNETDDPTRIGGNVSYGFGGGIYNDGVLEIKAGSVVDGNRASRHGVGIYNAGIATIIDSQIRNHAVAESFGGVIDDRSGAGIYNAGTLSVEQSVFEANAAHLGGAIYNAGSLAVDATTFMDNAVATLTSTPAEGAAIFDAGTDTLITNSTFTGGSATHGGAIVNRSNPNLMLDSNTVSGNSANAGGGFYQGGGTPAVLYRLEETAGTTAADAVGGHPGMFENGVTLGQFSFLGNSAEFDGADDYVSVADDFDASELDGDSYTIELWFNSSGNKHQSLVALTDGQAPSGHAALVELLQDNSIRFLNRIPTGISGGDDLQTASQAITPDVWHHLAAVRDGAEMTIYLDGAPVAAFAGAAGDLPDGLTLTLGRLGETPALAQRHFQGQLDEVAIYNVALPASEIAVHSRRIGAMPVTEASGAATTVRNSTIADNTATTAGGGVFSAGPVTFESTIIGHNSGPATPDGPDVRIVAGANVQSDGFNLIENTSGHDLVNGGGGGTDLVGFDPRLGPLDDNGGPTPTHGLLPGSAAIDTSFTRDDLNHLTDEEIDALTDQRGETRIFGPAADRGAFESMLSRGTLAMRVDTLSGDADGFYDEGDLSIAEAVLLANAIPGPDAIAFAPDIVESLRQNGAATTIDMPFELPVSDDLTIHGPGADLLALRAQAGQRVLHILPDVTAEITGLTIRDGSLSGAERGAGILNEGDLTLQRVVLTENRAPDTGSEGGAIANLGTLALVASTLHDNEAALGGGIWNSGQLNILNSTLSNNAAGVRGGAVRNIATMDVVNTTVAFNNAPAVGGFNAAGGTLNVANSIIALNTGSDPNIGGTWNNQGNNLVGGDPLLGVLRNLGGTTPVHGLLPGSPAIDQVSPEDAPRTDQRGVPRPIGTESDIGAFEFEPPALANPIVVDSTSGMADGLFAPGEMSLVEAILFVNDPANTTLNQITFDLGPDPANITLSGDELVIARDVSITGPGADLLTVDGGRASRVLRVEPFIAAQISGLTMTGGETSDEGGAIRNSGSMTLIDTFISDSSVTAPQGKGGAIFNDHFLTVVGSTVAGHSAFEGGGIYNASAGDLAVLNSTFSTNTATGSGSAGGGLFNAGVADIDYATVAQNAAAAAGGLATTGTLTLSNTIVADNSSTSGNGHDIQGSVTSDGNNLIGRGEGSSGLVDGANGDIVGTNADPVDPRLSDLVVIASAMPLHGLLPGSPAKDQAATSPAVNVDQRGVTRPLNSVSDIGALEMLPFVFDDLVVDNLSDVLNADYDPGDMTLREAILWANETAGSDDIRFSDALIAEILSSDSGAATITLRGEELTIADDLVLSTFSDAIDVIDDNSMDQLTVLVDGASHVFQVDDLRSIVTISANDQSRILAVEPGVTADILGMTIADGMSGQAGGAIINEGILSLTDARVAGSFSGGEGGGIASLGGSLSLQRVEITGNETDSHGGGVFNHSESTLAVKYSTISGNVVLPGFAQAVGGGISNFGEADIFASTIAHNDAPGQGGGVYNVGTLVLENNTVSNNSSQIGGGLFNASVGMVINTTITSNHGSSEAGGLFDQADLTLANTILAGNSAPQAPDGRVLTPPTSLGGNLIGNDSGFSFSAAAGDQVNVDPMLGPLADNGGPTQTHLLKFDSPAIDAGDPDFTPMMDQRGRPMVDILDSLTTIDPDVDAVDIGAYEVQQLATSAFRFEALDNSQFGPGQAQVFGFGFDDGRDNSSVQTKPHFLGFEFDTGPMTFGHIATGLFNTKFGGELNADFSGKLGFDVGFYVNSGSVDVTYDGAVNYVIDADSTTSADISAFLDIDDGGLYTVSPKFGAYADLVLELNADASITACLFGCVGFPLLDIHFSRSEEMFAVNRQMEDDFDRPMFLDPAGNPVARDPESGDFFDIDGGPISDPGPVVALFDGDLRYFSLPIEGIAKGIVAADQTAREQFADRKAVRDVDAANKGSADALNKLDQQNDALDQAAARMMNPSTEQAFINARQRVTQLAGKDYADAIDAGGPLPAKEGSIKEAEDALVDAKRRKDAAENQLKTRKNQKLRSPMAGVGVAVSEADGNLLGAQLDLEVGIGLGALGVSKRVGSVQATLPDVNLRDTSPDSLGNLSATTDDFPLNSELDRKRQIASAQVDLASLIPVFPGGKYNLTLGPVSLNATTVSYDLGPELNVTQDVTAAPLPRQLTYSFFVDRGGEFDYANAAPDANVKVFINGQAVQDDADPADDIGGVDTVSTWSFTPGDRVRVDTSGTTHEDDVLRVAPTLDLDARFSNDIGLDIDLEGVFEAFALNLSAFGFSIVDIGPLIRHTHTLSRFDVGSVFDRTFDLGTESVPLATFTLFDQVMDGRTAATAFAMTPPDGSNQALKDIGAADITVGKPVFFSSELADPAAPDEFHTVLDVTVTGADVESLEVLDENLAVTSSAPGVFQVTGFRPEMLSERSSALFAVKFSTVPAGTATVSTIRSDPMTLAALPDTTNNVGEITREAFQQVGVSAVLTNDIDGDGKASPLTDGLLIGRYLEGRTGNALVDNALGTNAVRTDPQDIVNYIKEVVEKSILHTDPQTQMTTGRSTLDFDGDGNADAIDATLLARYLAGFRGMALTDSITSTPAAEIVSFIETGRSSASDIEEEQFAQVLDRGGNDLLDLDGVLNADRHDGSSPTGALESAGPAAGSSPELALAATETNQDMTPQSFSFVLDQYGNSVMYQEVFLDGNLISRLAEGSPLDFGAAEHADLVDTGIDPARLASQMESSVLGVEEPIFIRAPDAVSYEYEALDGFMFDTVVIDPQVGGNLLLPGEFDLYVFNQATGTWEFATLISGSNPSQVGINGFLVHQFPTPVSSFRLYSHASPNEELYGEENLSSPEPLVTTGFLLAEPPGGAAGPPSIEMTKIADRLSFTMPEPTTIEAPVHTSDSDATATTFHLVRSGADVIPSVNSAPGNPVQMVSAVELAVVGHDNVEDMLVLDSSGGPFRMPLAFRGGFRDDVLMMDPANGAGVTIDLAGRDSISEVELLDIRGSGTNEAVVNLMAVTENDPFRKTLRVLGDTDDLLTIDAGWTIDGAELIDGLTYDRYIQDDALLLAAQGMPVSVAASALNAAALETSGDERRAAIHKEVTMPVARDDVFSLAASATVTQPNGSPRLTAQGNSMIMRQIVTAATEEEPVIEAGHPVTVSVEYETDDLAATTGLHLRLHFDSSQLTLESLNSILPEGFSVSDVQSEPVCDVGDCGGFDGDPETDTYVNLFWMDTEANWPANLPVELFTANFTASSMFSGRTHINFSGHPAAGYALSAAAILLLQPPLKGDLDLDGDFDFDDIDDFVLGLTDPSAYELARGISPHFAGDLDLDGDLDFDDIDDFVAALTGTGEPSGAMAGDGELNVDDIDNFVFGLTDPVGYETVFGRAPATQNDLDDDGDLDFDDIDEFFSALTRPESEAASHPAMRRRAARPADRLNSPLGGQAPTGEPSVAVWPEAWNWFAQRYFVLSLW